MCTTVKNNKKYDNSELNLPQCYVMCEFPFLFIAATGSSTTVLGSRLNVKEPYIHTIYEVMVIPMSYGTDCFVPYNYRNEATKLEIRCYDLEE
jgi:hypothetical protein